MWTVIVDEDGVRIREQRGESVQIHQFTELPESLDAVEEWIDAQGFEVGAWEFPRELQTLSGITLVAEIYEKFGL